MSFNQVNVLVVFFILPSSLGLLVVQALVLPQQQRSCSYHRRHFGAGVNNDKKASYHYSLSSQRRIPFLDSTSRRRFVVLSFSAGKVDDTKNDVMIDINAEESDDKSSTSWTLGNGFLFSSFTDGFLSNPVAQERLKQAIILVLLKQQQTLLEKRIESSVMFSPCAGPDIYAVNDLETIDSAIETLEKQQTATTTSELEKVLKKFLPTPTNTTLRLAFIPTAMYAVNPDSNNTPGKQRQRARADGKKRRNRIVNLLQEIFTPTDSIISSISSVTIDFADGSVKQPDCTTINGDNPDRKNNDDGYFPSTAHEALTTWEPHLVYVQGGNTFFLYQSIEKGQWQPILKDLISTTGNCLYMGQSAGAIIAGSRLSTACWKGWDDPRVVPGRESYEDWSSINGLQLVGNYSFFPHMDDQWQTTVNEKQTEDSSVTPLICIRDENVYYVDGTAQQITEL